MVHGMTGQVNNPDGKGGFSEHPENRSDGRWSKDESISYWYNKLLRMPDDEYEKFKPANKSQKIAWSMVENADERRPDIVKEITDRTEGKAPQSIDLKSDGEKFQPLVVEIINAPNDSNTK